MRCCRRKNRKGCLSFYKTTSNVNWDFKNSGRTTITIFCKPSYNYYNHTILTRRSKWSLKYFSCKWLVCNPWKTSGTSANASSSPSMSDMFTPPLPSEFIFNTSLHYTQRMAKVWWPRRVSRRVTDRTGAVTDRYTTVCRLLPASTVLRMRIHVHIVDKKAKSVMEAAAGPSRALMEISQLLTQTADDFHKMAKKTKLSDSGNTSATATTTVWRYR